jgi:CDP-glucose 4,6-dehydratase
MKNQFKNKKVLITGHTGFKGSWLVAWLNLLGAEVLALSKDIPTKPAHYDLIKKLLKNDIRLDITNYSKISKAIIDYKPDFLFHLAAQPIVLTSYNNPLLTFQSNTVGTLNVLESLRKSNHNCAAVIITSDKCYENLDKNIKYKEIDRMGGKDPYSASKGSAEIIIRSYCESFFKTSGSNIRLASARAGNVIGGGDWADHRIVPDCIKSWANNKEVVIRNSMSTRPWQHVLEPLSGYLTLALKLRENKKINGESFNFGPSSNKEYSVGNLVSKLSKEWPNSNWDDTNSKNKKLYEASLLSLNCDKASKLLNWKSVLDFPKTAKWTAQWYYKYYNCSKQSAIELTINQIQEYSKLSKMLWLN